MLYYFIVLDLLLEGNTMNRYSFSSSKILKSYYRFFIIIGLFLEAYRVRLFVSNDGFRIVLICQNFKVNVWEQVSTNSEGEWTTVSFQPELLGSLASKETVIDARFISNQVNTCGF